MNERIRELAEQAGFQYEYYKDILYLDGLNPSCAEEVSDLATLIVKECVEICNKIYFDRYPDAEDFERSEEGDAIKKHFGVKE